MLRGEGNARERWKTTIGVISRKATLYVQRTSFVHFCAVVLQDYDVKLSENSLLRVFWRKFRTSSCSFFFFTAAHFHLALVAASISYFVTAATKFSCCSSSFFVFLSLALDLCRLFLAELRLPAAYFLFFSVFLLLHIPNLWTWRLI